ncbi:Eif2d [Scenedesmus sp. PABB004]|nr:Eif2d [Scenedesmus sp. PABB004]
MFKKSFAVNQTHKVSGADRKKLRRSLERALRLGPDSDALEALLPAKAGDLELAKLPAPSRAVLYLLDGRPVLLDASGKGDLSPTVMGLWAAPGALPVVLLRHHAVSRFILQGADVMLPGVEPESLPAFAAGDLLAVAVPGNPCAIAVGVAAMASDAAAAAAAGAAPRGRLVELVQFYGDALWAGLGRGETPNPGFLPGLVVPPELVAAGGAEAAAAAAAAEDSDGGDSDSGAGAPAAGVAGLSLAAGAEQPAQQPAGGGDGAAVAAAAAAGSEWPDNMDKLLELALLQALAKSVKDGDLPLPSAGLWSQHITPSRPPGTLLDVKRSSHKKVSKFLAAYARAGLLSTKEDKHSGDTIVTAVHRGHALLQEHRPYKTAGASASAAPGGAGAAGGAAAGGEAALPPLEVEEVYKPSREVKPIFEAVGADPDGYYSAAAAGCVPFDYAAVAGLDAMAPDPTIIMLDPVLCDALFKGVLRKGELFPTHIPKAELRDAFLRRMAPQTCVRRGERRLLRKGAPPAVCISGERRQGNKYVTRVTGLEAFLVDPAAVASEAQRKYAAATSVADLPGKHNPGQEVILQPSLPGAPLMRVAMERLLSGLTRTFSHDLEASQGHGHSLRRAVAGSAAADPEPAEAQGSPAAPAWAGVPLRTSVSLPARVEAPGSVSDASETLSLGSPTAGALDSPSAARAEQQQQAAAGAPRGGKRAYKIHGMDPYEYWSLIKGL